ncbi:MAG TPA: type VI secretion system accessory protein TagJ [Polyangiales bacterium]|nr:type VI secretion system accessory protein TagJ [Polyangiales bacterium]
MRAEQCLRQGKLEAALDALQSEVRSVPSDFKLRVFLFQLLAVLGQWERAVKQLQVAASLDAEGVPMAQTYRELLRCELTRAEVFRGDRTPHVVGLPAPWLGLMFQALVHTAQGEHAAAESLRAQALEQAPASPGSLNGQPFGWLADSDSRIGPALEAVIRGRYCWVPFSAMQRVEFELPVDLRDVVWLPAKLTSTQGEALECFIPSRYCASELHADDAVRLARKTIWEQPTEHTACGLGQRMFVTDCGEHALLELRDVRFASEGAGEDRHG